MPILSVLATLLKSRFFVIYYRCVTLADEEKSLPLGEGAPQGRMRAALFVFCCTAVFEKMLTLISQKSMIFASFPQGKPLLHLCDACATIAQTKARAFYGKDSICLPREDSSEFRKVLVPLRKSQF